MATPSTPKIIYRLRADKALNIVKDRKAKNNLYQNIKIAGAGCVAAIAALIGANTGETSASIDTVAAVSADQLPPASTPPAVLDGEKEE
jgi:hypothetical protein